MVNEGQPEGDGWLVGSSLEGVRGDIPFLTFCPSSVSFWYSDVIRGALVAIFGHEEHLRMTEHKDRRTLEAASYCAALGLGTSPQRRNAVSLSHCDWLLSKVNS